MVPGHSVGALCYHFSTRVGGGVGGSRLGTTLLLLLYFLPPPSP